MTDQKHFGIDLDMKMSLGNMITIGVLVATIVFGYATVQADLNTAKSDIGKNTTRIERLETQGGEMKDRLTRMEVIMQNLSVQMDRAVRLLEQGPTPPRRSPP